MMTYFVTLSENQKREKYGWDIFLHKSLSNRWFGNGIHSLLRQVDARGSADVIYCMWRLWLRCMSGNTIFW